MKFALPLIIMASCMVSQWTMGQKKTAYISGRVLGEDETPLAKVSVIILGRQNGISTDDSGTFRIKVPADKAFALLFSFTGYRTEQRNFLLNPNEEEQTTIRLERNTRELKEVVVTNQNDRKASGLIKINPKDAINIPSPTGGIESLIKVFVGSNNELTSQYNVRGGSYDENLIYVNDFEIFRPYLINNGQQEGLSFINPELTKNVNFYNGGFEARFGDKMSSALDIEYRKPKKFGGSAYIGLLEQGLHLEGVTDDHKLTYLVGVRNRTNKNLLNSQETQGIYSPSSSDIQGLITYQFNPQNSIEFLGVLSQTRFSFIPQSSQLTASVFSPFITENLGLDINFNGQEKDQYQTNLLGLSFIQQVHKNLRLKWLVSGFGDNETQAYDITGAYIFGERNFDNSGSSFGQIINPLGSGIYQNYARDHLNISSWNATHKGYLETGIHYFQWGLSAERQTIHEKLYEWEYQDSAGYSLPNNPGNLLLSNYIHSGADLGITRLTGFLQDNIAFNNSRDFTLQAGIRYNYNNLNNQFLISPRLGFSWKPKNDKKDIVYKASLGVYDQPPFFREMVKPDGSLNTGLKAQKSWQASTGFDYNFKSGDRPFRLATEAYYKSISDAVAYDITNVKIQYDGINDSKAYAVGIESRLFGQLVKDAESWISIGIMHSMQKIDNSYYENYTLDSSGKPVDSSLVKQGWIRRPTDRLFTMGMFLQDYLPTNKNFKAFLNLLYGSNLPYSVPGSVKYREALIIPPYIRVDLGFSALLLDSEKGNRRSHSPFRNFENIWATLEVFNVINRANTISYMFIKDYANTVYAIPQTLTPRLLNLKLVARF